MYYTLKHNAVCYLSIYISISNNKAQHHLTVQLAAAFFVLILKVVLWFWILLLFDFAFKFDIWKMQY